MPRSERRSFLTTFSPLGLVLGTIFVAASLTPSLVPRPAAVQGVLSGLALSLGYLCGVALRSVWVGLQLPEMWGKPREYAAYGAIGGCTLVVGLALWWASSWQNRLRELMEMDPIEGLSTLTIFAVMLIVFAVLLLVARLIRWTTRAIWRPLSRILPGPQAALIAVVLTAILFWNLGNGVLIANVFGVLDTIYTEIDRRFEEESPRPSDPLKTGSDASLLTWEGLGRAGREMIARGPDQARIEEVTGQPALEPLRVYVGLGSAETPAERAELALAELLRIGAFERTNLVISTPTGTGWIDPEGQTALEYVLRGDVATVSVQYSYLASWLALIAVPDYGVETAKEVFGAVYGHWTTLPPDDRPRLYLNGLSLGSFNSDLSHDLHQVIGDPFDGAFWIGPPFNSRTWQHVTRARNEGSPAWLPRYGDGSTVRFTSQTNALDEGFAPWSGFRVVYLQYASDGITFFDRRSAWRKPDWMQEPMGPDVSPDFVWIPVVTFLQLAVDLMIAVLPPLGHGHSYHFDHYVDGWIALTDAPGWTPDSIAALKARNEADRP